MARYDGPIIDVDIHHRCNRDSEVFAYLSREWRSYAEESRFAPLTARPPAYTLGTMLENGARLADAFPADGSFPGSSYEYLRNQLLDKYPYYRAVLTHDLGEFGQHLNHEFGVDLCRAANDWNIDNWLSLDERLYSVVAVANSSPEAAAREIRRVGSHPKFVSVLLAGNGLGRPYGDPIYHPIYEAAAEMGLGIAVHLALNRPSSVISTVGGAMSTGIAYTSQLGQEAMHYATSFIVNGVFEKYPSLKVIFKEFGTAWLPSVVWGMDRQYELLQLESSWVKRWPSEYFHDHIRLSTQPFEESPDPKSMMELMRSLDGAGDMLCFSTDYPHSSFDDPAYVARLLPPEWHSKIFCENACDLYGWPIPAHAQGRGATTRLVS